MKRVSKKISSLMLVFAMIFTMALTGCGKNTESNTMSNTASNTTGESAAVSTKGEDNSDSGEGIDTLKEVTIVGYLLGSAPAGMDNVLTALNEKLKAKINAALDLRYLDWADYTTKYPLILAAGEDVDFMYTADWCMYAQEATKNAFREITEEDLKTYMPLHYAACDPIAQEEAKLNGKSYMITTSTPDKRVTLVVYRKDLADKYGVTNLSKLSDFTPYFKAIAENETEIQPMYMAISYDSLYGALANEAGGEIGQSPVNLGLCYTLEDSKINLSPMYEEPYASAYKNAFNILKQWYDAGYINKDILSYTVTSRESFLEGKSAIAIGNSVDMQSVIASAKDKGFETGIIPMLDKQGKTAAVSYLNNGAAIAATSKNPERTMMALDLIMEDKEFNYLAYLGIEGENYIITDDGKVGLPEGVNGENNTYPIDAAGFWFTNKEQIPPLASWTDDYVALKNKIPDMLYDQKFTAFSPDQTNIQTEIANLTQVIQQYGQPLQVGMVENVDDAFAILKDKMIAAGMEAIQKEVQKQADVYMGQ